MKSPCFLLAAPVLGALILLGCPAPPGPTAPPGGGAPPPPQPGTSPQSRPAPGASPATGSAATPSPAPAAAPSSPGTASGAPGGAPPEPELRALAPREVLHLSRRVSVGLEQVEELPLARGRELVARVAVCSAPWSYVCELPRGARLRCGDEELEVLEVAAARVSFRWRRVPGATAPVDLVRPVQAAALRQLAPMGLYALPDGRRLGVGNVLELRRHDGAVVRVVTLSLYAAGFRGEPGDRYDVIRRLVPGRAAPAPRTGARVLLVRAEPEGVELRLD
ncbi:MAG: hypothetical protein AB7N76_35330 [Planctomycetota bacterium]